MPRHTHPERVWAERQRIRRLIRGPVAKKRATKRKHKRDRSCDGMRRYRDQAEAIGAIHLFQTHSGRETIPVRAFACEHCGGWHSTTRPTWS